MWSLGLIFTSVNLHKVVDPWELPAITCESAPNAGIFLLKEIVVLFQKPYNFRMIISMVSAVGVLASDESGDLKVRNYYSGNYMDGQLVIEWFNFIALDVIKT